MTAEQTQTHIMSDTGAVPIKRRKFLVVVDGTPECEVAIQFASRRARHTKGGVVLLAVLEPGGFEHWLGVENLMKEEARQEAEKIVHRHAAHVNDVAGIVPELEIREGKQVDLIRDLIKEDPAISILVLAAGTGKEGPGPLVEMVAGGVDAGFSIPVTVVPGSLTDEEIHDLA
ncbi:MAG: universal stress protein UspA [Rhodobiaceae bacterium]|nr:MAG: universal stress protein UspA [Rhodobiaceae bacterium]